MIGRRSRRANRQQTSYDPGLGWSVRPALGAAAHAAQARLRETYADGFADGVRETLKSLDGTSTAAPDGIYPGPVPPELTLWIRGVRERIDGDNLRERARTV